MPGENRPLPDRYASPVQTRLDDRGRERARRALRRRDPSLAAVIREVGPCGLRWRGDPFGSLQRSILYQQLAGAAAGAIDRRFRQAFGGRYPRPLDLLAARPAQLRKLGLSRQKIAAMRDLARAFRDGTLSARRLAHLDDAEVVAAVTAVKGVGPWTAHMLLMFSLGRPDVLPVGDYGIRKGARRVYGLAELPDAAQLEKLGETWRPYRSVASWYLWRAVELPDGSIG